MLQLQPGDVAEPPLDAASAREPRDLYFQHFHERGKGGSRALANQIPQDVQPGQDVFRTGLPHMEAPRGLHARLPVNDIGSYRHDGYLHGIRRSTHTLVVVECPMPDAPGAGRPLLHSE